MRAPIKPVSVPRSMTSARIPAQVNVGATKSGGGNRSLAAAKGGRAHRGHPRGLINKATGS